ncbi:MAG: efflux RND transporter permease subunit [Planctomycetes bacterium]|nr:efflux RND transporter permease subunit [Planctomycetota bacterium]
MSLPRFGVTNPVPVNLLMGALIIAGIAAAAKMTREFFPETTPESASVTLPYPGATPDEIEETLARKVEDAIADLDEVDRLTTTLSEGGGGIFVEFRDGVTDVQAATDEVERAIDALTDLPDDAERIQVTEFEPRLPAISVSVFGDVEEELLKRAIMTVRDDLRSLDGMGEVVRSGVRDYEIRVDVSSDALLEHRLSLSQMSDTIRAWMTDVPGGTVRTRVGNINVRTLGVEERAGAIRDIVIKATPDGQVLRVGDVAQVRETFVDVQVHTRFLTRDAGGSSASLTVYKTGDQDTVAIAEMVRAYVRGRRYAAGNDSATFEYRLADRLFEVMNGTSDGSGKGSADALRTQRRVAYDLGLRSAEPLPAGCDIATSSDLARFIEGRLDLLIRNARYGAVLVFATLLLFLNWRTAWWVGVGLLTALCGTLLFMSVAGVTLNLLTMFGLIVVLGLLVDDAIVVAENIQARHDRNEPAATAAIGGTEQVFWPVVATILTSIVAFLPLTFVTGQIGDLLGALPWVVTCALIMSLIESVLILPSHMAHSLRHRDRAHAGREPSVFEKFEAWRDRMIFERLVPAYAWLLGWALRFRYVSLCFALLTLIASLGMVAGGRLQFTFIPASDSETVIADIRMPIGTSIDETTRIVSRVEAAAAQQPEMKSISTLLGVRAAVDDLAGVVSSGLGTHLGQLFIELTPVEQRDRESTVVTAAIRAAAGRLDGIESLEFTEVQGGPGGRDISVDVSGENDAEVDVVVREVKRLVASMEGVVDVSDDRAVGQREVQISLEPGAAALGFTVADVARQVRGALFGLEPHVFSAKREDIDVRVRLDEDARRSLDAIERMWVVGPGGRRVPLQEIATLREGSSYNTIRRVDRQRVVTVSADTAPELSPETIVGELKPSLMKLQEQYPTVGIELSGRQRQLRKAFESLPVGFLAALIMIYLILAWLFSSYVQPLAVMLAIPFGMIGVIWGHLTMGYDLTFLSLIGFVALSGIVVNDSLILVQFFNERIASGDELRAALVAAGRQRLRPIMLTTITTVLGLTPLMLEQSFQAKFLIPMAISISFGLMSATVLILLVLPCIMVIVDDLKAAGHYLWFGRRRGPGAPSGGLEEDPVAG